MTMQIDRNQRSAIITTNTYVARDDVVFAYAGAVVDIDVMANDDRPANAVVNELDDSGLAIVNADGTIGYDLTGFRYDPDNSSDQVVRFKYTYANDPSILFPEVTINVLWGTPGLGGSPHKYTNGFVRATETNYSFNALDYVDPDRAFGTTLTLSKSTMDGVAFDADLASDGTISFDPSQFHFLRYSFPEKQFEFEITATNAQGQSATTYIAVDVSYATLTGETFGTTSADKMAIGGAGNDTLYGSNSDSNVLLGGKGGDNFYFSDSVNDDSIASNVVLDYDVVGDTVHFDAPTEITSMVEVYDGLIVVYDDGSDTLFINGDGVTRANADIQNVYVPPPPSGASPGVDDVLLTGLLFYGDPLNWGLFNPELPFVSYW